jgi:hypothetical protein
MHARTCMCKHTHIFIMYLMMLSVTQVSSDGMISELQILEDVEGSDCGII